MVDLAWRYDQGQSPGVDFPSTFPSLFMGAIRSSAMFGSSSWSALLIVGLLTGIGAAVTVAYCLSNAGLSSRPLLALAAIAVIIPWVASTHLWHSSLTAQVAAATITAGVAVVRCPRRSTALFLGMLLGLTIAGKPNVAWIAVGGVSILLVTMGRRRVVTSTFVAAGVTFVFVAWWARVDLSYPFTSALNFIGERERRLMVVPPGTEDLNGLLLLFLPWVALPLLLLLAAAVFAWAGRCWRSPIPPEAWGALIAGLAWFSGIMTNWDSHWNEFPLAGISIALLLSQMALRGRSRLVTASSVLAHSSLHSQWVKVQAACACGMWVRCLKTVLLSGSKVASCKASNWDLWALVPLTREQRPQAGCVVNPLRLCWVLDCSFFTHSGQFRHRKDCRCGGIRGVPSRLRTT